MNALALMNRLQEASEVRSRAVATCSRGDPIAAERLHQIADGHDRAAKRIAAGLDPWEALAGKLEAVPMPRVRAIGVKR